MPYKSELHYVHLKHCGYVVAYWTFSFSLKFVSAFIHKLSPDGFGRVTSPDVKIDPRSGSSDDSESEALFYAIIYFGLNVTCDIVPYLIVIDCQFIKIFTFDLIRKCNQDESENKDAENAMSDIK